MPTTISLPQPCPENWDAMPPTGAGRHCAACQQVVVDFTAMTDGEVVAFLRQRPDVACGWFGASQLDRPLVAAARSVGGWRRWLGVLAALLGAGSLAAPAARSQSLLHAGSAGPLPDYLPGDPAAAPVAAPVPSAPVASAIRAVPATAPAPAALVVRGRVCNWLGMPVGGGRVYLYSATHAELGSVVSDQWGRFALPVPAGHASSSLSLYARHRAAIGRATHYLSATTPVADPAQPCRVVLERHRRVMGGKFRVN